MNSLSFSTFFLAQQKTHLQHVIVIETLPRAQANIGEVEAAQFDVIAKQAQFYR